MQAIIYLGPLRIAKTKYGQFARGKRADLPDVVAREVLKLPGFEEPTFPARYIGRVASRSLRVQGGKIIVCPRGIWTALPVTIKYKINADADFELGPSGISAKSLIRKQREDTARKEREARRVKHKRAPAPVAATITEKVEEVREKSLDIAKLGLSKFAVQTLRNEGIRETKDLPGATKLLRIKGIGVATVRSIKEALKKEELTLKK